MPVELCEEVDRGFRRRADLGFDDEAAGGHGTIITDGQR
jgi:hypothetical protein